MQQWRVSKAEATKNLGKFVYDGLGGVFSRRKIKEGIDSGLCTVDGCVEKFASAPVQVGATIRFDDETLGERLQQRRKEFDEGRILYEDSDMLFYNKPAALRCDDPHFWEGVREHYPQAAFAHRLDADTTGVWLWAKNSAMGERLEELFRQRRVEKRYLAMVDGVPAEEEGVIQSYLGRVDHVTGLVQWASVPEGQGRWAETAWQRLESGRGAALLSCYPKTGRTHQIRVHLKELGHPILGDTQYCRRFSCAYRPRSLLLHAERLSLVHPGTNALLDIQAPIPAHFEEAIAWLRGETV